MFLFLVVAAARAGAPPAVRRFVVVVGNNMGRVSSEERAKPVRRIVLEDIDDDEEEGDLPLSLPGWSLRNWFIMCITFSMVSDFVLASLVVCDCFASASVRDCDLFVCQKDLSKWMC